VICVSYVPAFALGAPGCLSTADVPLQAKATKAYSRAGGIAQEAVSNLRTVAAYGQEEAAVKSYASALTPPTKVRRQHAGTARRAAR
jgi:ATP-binding cassette subfamily B (MDR/TAP) protein 1